MSSRTALPRLALGAMVVATVGAAAAPPATQAC